MNFSKPFSRIFLILFLLVSIIDILAIIAGSNFWQSISKPLIIPALLAYYLSVSKVKHTLYIIALFFSFLGDVLLLDKNNLFLYGIGAFLITQLLYVYIFSKGLKDSPRSKKVLAFAPFMVFFIVLMSVLRPGLQNFLIPVLIYGMAISVFGAISLLRFLIKPDKASLSLLSGALLFIMSDSMIALDKFHEHHYFYGIVIMLTYIMAQFLIAFYMLRSEDQEEIV